MRAADLAGLSALMEMARRAAEMRLAAERASIDRLRHRIAALRADLARPMVPPPLAQTGTVSADIGAQIAWRRGLEARLREAGAEIAAREAAATARRAELTHAFGRARAAATLEAIAIDGERRDAARRAEGMAAPRKGNASRRGQVSPSSGPAGASAGGS